MPCSESNLMVVRYGSYLEKPLSVSCLEQLVDQTPILLKSNSNLSVTFMQEQCAALLSCAFFCAFPNRQSHLTYRSVNFHTDNSGRRSIKCVAIDAIHFEQPEQQYTIANIERELVKSYCAFSGWDETIVSSFGVATGH
ncbi:unnamed protein product [Didymodactylos carnosus]|uniref:PARG catalytic Macro domain-containing protein n=1 Tax=Didymodactylos carnosus TaxID=1234261 RepID=A0A814YNW5_9BILA|nr:unnamed protein product [Didymodactylos carnosus]CAF3995213.1 unnamed protein product [Didymodactylos carnosus]